MSVMITEDELKEALLCLRTARIDFTVLPVGFSLLICNPFLHSNTVTMNHVNEAGSKSHGRVLLAYVEFIDCCCVQREKVSHGRGSSGRQIGRSVNCRPHPVYSVDSAKHPF